MQTDHQTKSHNNRGNLGPLVKRRQQLSESIAEWNRTAPRILREELLFDTSGKLNEVRIGAFQHRRNNRIVILGE